MLWRLVASLLSVLFAPILLVRRAMRLPPGSFLEMEIDGAVVDVFAPKPIHWIKAPKITALHVVARVVDRMNEDDRVRGILVTVKSLEGGMASVASLARILQRARDRGKEVVLHFPLGMGSKETILAGPASKVVVGPPASVAPLGFVKASRYVKRALDKAGLRADVYARGEFKSAGENLVRDSMSEENKAQLAALLDAFHDALVSAIERRTGLAREAASSIVDRAPYTPAEAIEEKLVDLAAYEDEVKDRIAGDARFFDAGDYLARAEATLVRPFLRRPCIGVVSVSGAITQASGFFTPVSTDERAIRAIRAARRDRKVRGVILHVDSPGGSALASDRIHHELVQLAKEKPLVCCMANVAASGGYYIAAAAHTIVAEPLTLTGSIGVVGARVVAEPLLDRLGVTVEVMRRGARAGLLEPTLPAGDEDKAAIFHELDAVYDTFLGVVCSGRKLSREKVDELARGRVWSGAAAKEHGLVDILGGFEDALREVRKAVGEGALPAKVVSSRKAVPPLALPSKAKDAAELLARVAGVGADDLAILELATGKERVLALAPDRLD